MRDWEIHHESYLSTGETREHAVASSEPRYLLWMRNSSALPNIHVVLIPAGREPERIISGRGITAMVALIVNHSVARRPRIQMGLSLSLRLNLTVHVEVGNIESPRSSGRQALVPAPDSLPLYCPVHHWKQTVHLRNSTLSNFLFLGILGCCSWRGKKPEKNRWE